MQSVGIDVGKHSIKVIELNVTKKGLSVHNYFEHQLGTNPSLDYELEVIDFLQQLLPRYNIENTKFNLALRQDQVSTISKTFPFSDKQKITKSLAFEIEEDLPFSVDDCVIDAKVLSYLGNQAEVLAVATQIETVDKFLRVFNDVGIEPNILTTEGCALFNLFEKWSDAPVSKNVNFYDENAARHLNIHIHMGHTHTIINFIEGVTPVCTRSILWGGKNLAESISAKYEIPYIEALKELQNKGFILTQKKGASWDQINFSDIISQSLQIMIKELKLILLEVKTQSNATFENVYMSGGPSQIINLGPYLTQNLEIPVNKLSTFETFANVTFEKNGKIEAYSPLALGLAIESLKKPKNPALNLLKGNFAKESNLFKNYWTVWGLSTVTASIVFVLFFSYAFLKEQATIDLNDRTHTTLMSLAKKIANIKGAKANISAVKTYIKKEQKKVQEIKSISMVAKMNSALDVLKKINDSIPSRNELSLEISKLDIKDNVVFIEGFAANPKQVELIKSSLTKASVDNKIAAPPSTLAAKGGKSSFAFSFSVDRNIQKTVK